MLQCGFDVTRGTTQLGPVDRYVREKSDRFKAHDPANCRAMMEGIVGRFLKCFGITMAATIMVSMLVSFTLTPMLAARWFKRDSSASSSASSNSERC